MDYLKTLEEIPAAVLEDVRVLNNLKLYAEVGQLVFRTAKAGYHTECIDDAVKMLELAADGGYSQCRLLLAEFYCNFRFGDPDIRKAMDYYQRACDPVRPYCCAVIIFYALPGFGISCPLLCLCSL